MDSYEQAKRIAQNLSALEQQIVAENSGTVAGLTLRRFLFGLLVWRYLDEQRLLTVKPFSATIAQSAQATLEALRTIGAFFRLTIFSDWPTLPQLNSEQARLLLDFETPREPEFLGFVYERFVRESDPNLEGVFYTPPKLVQSMVANTLQTVLEHQPGNDGAITVLDPACGSGNFLIEALRYLRAHYQAAGHPLTAWQVLGRSIFGIDRDPLAVQVCRLVLCLECYRDSQVALFPELLPDLAENIRWGDSLLDDTNFAIGRPEQLSFAPQLSFSWQGSFPKIMSRGGFDCILGNPPYGLSRNQQIAEDENEKLKSIYARFLNGKPNKYLIFMARGYELLRVSGSLSLVVPNSWLGIKSAKRIREILIGERGLAEVRLYGDSVFKELGVEVVTFRFDKGQRYRALRVVDEQRSGDTREFKLPFKACQATKDCRIPTNWTPSARQVLRRIFANSIPLGSNSSPFVPMIALQAYALGKGTPPQGKEVVEQHPFHSTEKLGADYWPYLEGSDVGRFQINWSGQFLKYGNHLAEPQSIDRFSRPRVLVREVLGPAPHLVSCAYSDSVQLYNKSVLHILGRGAASAEELLALTGLLNSRLASFVIKLCGRKSQRRLFPKIVNDDLTDFPLAKNFMRYAPELAAIAKQGLLSGPTPELERELNLCVLCMYHLGAKHGDLMK